MPLLFVYGTLKRSECRASFLRGQTFLGNVVTEPRYTLVDLGPYPALVRGGTTAVHGELYNVDAACLARLDIVEAVSEGLYERGGIVLVSASVDGDLINEAVTYFYLKDVDGYPSAGASWP